MATIDWQEWYQETLDALVEVIEESRVEWATDPEGNTWIVKGDRASSGLEYPACFVPSFAKQRDTTESSRADEWHVIEATILVLKKGDPKEMQANLEEALILMTQVESAIYANRSLKGTCERATVTQATPFAGVGGDDSPNLEGAEIQLEIRKQAEIHA